MDAIDGSSAMVRRRQDCPDEVIYRGRVIRPICGGEAARNVSVISAVIEPRRDGPVVIFREQQFFVADPARSSHRGMYSVRFEPVTTPQFYEPVGNGAAYLYKGDDEELDCVFDAEVAIAKVDGTYVSTNVVDEYGLVIILLAPVNMTITKYSRRPVMAKLSPDGRVAIAWALYPEPGRALRTTTLKWAFERIRTQPRSAVEAILKDTVVEDRREPADPAGSQLDHTDLQEIRRSYGPGREPVPAWFPIAGVSFAVITFASLFYLLVAGPDLSSRHIIFDAWLAFCLAASAAFLGGTAASHGSLPIPLVQDAPVKFSAYGGVAVFLVAFVVLGAFQEINNRQPHLPLGPPGGGQAQFAEPSPAAVSTSPTGAPVSGSATALPVSTPPSQPGKQATTSPAATSTPVLGQPLNLPLTSAAAAPTTAVVGTRYIVGTKGSGAFLRVEGCETVASNGPAEGEPVLLLEDPSNTSTCKRIRRGNGQEGYVSRDYLSLSPPTPEPTALTIASPVALTTPTTPACTRNVDPNSKFAAHYASIATKLGCAKGPEFATNAAAQHFAQGLMVWVQRVESDSTSKEGPVGFIVLTTRSAIQALPSDSRFDACRAVQSCWFKFAVPDLPPSTSQCPSSATPYAEHGFGLLLNDLATKPEWKDWVALTRALGLARECEYGFRDESVPPKVQNFDGGALVWMPTNPLRTRLDPEFVAVFFDLEPSAPQGSGGEYLEH